MTKSKTKTLYAPLLALPLLLVGCGEDSDVQLPPLPTPYPQLGEHVFSADWKSPNIGLGVACTQDVPPVCAGTSEWVTFDRPGTEGQACTLDAPNECYSSSDGILSVTAPAPGFPIILREQFSKDKALSVEMTVSADCQGPYCYIGPVIYNGELNYRGLYLDARGIMMYGPKFGTRITTVPFVPNLDYDLRVDYFNGVWTYTVNKIRVLTELDGSLSTDPTTLTEDPRFAFWVGQMNAKVKKFDIYVTGQ